MAQKTIGIGIDGCRAGWLMVLFDGTTAEMQMLPEISAFAELDLAGRPVWVDMPIGFMDNGADGRECDRAARKYLSPLRHSSVFTPPCRAAVYAEKSEASAMNFEHTGKKLSQQSLNIVPKIRELDSYLTSLSIPDRLLWSEAHPEVVFGALNGGQPLVHKKKNKEGEQQRLQLLQPWFPEVFDWMANARGRYLRKDVLPDDIVDALGLAIASYLVQSGLAQERKLPSNPTRDQEGLLMQIVYAVPR